MSEFPASDFPDDSAAHRIWWEGHSAFLRAGVVSQNDCPYNSPRRRELWERGWWQARDEGEDRAAIARPDSEPTLAKSPKQGL